jgi:hypothetical protein
MTDHGRCREEERLLVLEFRHVQNSFRAMDQDQMHQILVGACLHQIVIVGLEERLRHLC